jgi:hypothetical protein
MIAITSLKCVARDLLHPSDGETLVCTAKFYGRFFVMKACLALRVPDSIVASKLKITACGTQRLDPSNPSR